MQSPTHGSVTIDEMMNLMKQYMANDPTADYEVSVGTDSQNFDTTKVVLVVAVHRVGKGGIFFYEINRVSRIKDLRQKIYLETQMSLEMAEKLRDRFKSDHISCKVTVHSDIGEEGETCELIPEITGWVKAMGFDCKTKVNKCAYSYTASGIANKISK